MKHIKKFNEGFFDFLKKGKKDSTAGEGGDSYGERPRRDDYSSINKDDNSLIPFHLFHQAKEIRNIIDQKIENLESDDNFIEIMGMIKNGEIKKAKSDTERNHFRIGKNAKFVLNDGRVISVHPVKTWESSNGDYDIYYVMIVNNSPLGYISYSNYKYILGEVNKNLDF